jgi:hypothetical protein
MAVNTVGADIARNYLRNFGFDTTGLSAEELADKLHQIEPSEYYQIVGWTPDTPTPAPTPASAPAPAPAPAPVPEPPLPPAPPPLPPPAPVPVLTPAPVAVPETQQPAQEFFNPYQPGSYEYEMVEATRGQEPGTGGVVTIAQTPDILRVQQAAPPPGFNTFNQVTSIILSVATIAVPGLNSLIGEAILSSAGITAASEAVTAGVGSAALSAATTAAAGGNAEDVLKNAASAGFASGVNIGLGGGVAGAAAGSAVGTTIRGGNVDQVLTNALAAGVGAGVGGVIGPAAGSIATSLVSTGGVSNQTLFNAAISEINGFNKANNASALIVEGQRTPTAEQLLTQQILSENQNIGPNVAGIGGDVLNVLAGNIAAQQNLSPEAKSVVDQITLAGAGDPQAFAPALAPLLTPGGAAVASAAAAETAVLLARLAQTPAGQNAIRQAAAVNQNVMSALGTLGAMIGIAPAAFLAGDPLPQAQVQNIAINGAPANFGKFDPGTGTGWDAPKTAPTIKPVSVTARPPVDTTSPYPETALSRYPAPTSPTIGDNIPSVEPAAIPQTAEIINVAGRLNITVEEAAALSQQSPTLFNQVSGNTGTREFTPDELDKIRQTDLVAMGIVSGAGNIPSSEAVNQDFNVIISGNAPAGTVPTIGQKPTLASDRLDIINAAGADPIYTKLDAAVKSGVDVFPEITKIASSQRIAGGDKTATINSIMQTANQIGIDPQKAATTAINAWYSTEVSPSVESSTKTTTQPTTQTSTQPSTELTTKPLLKPLTTTQPTTEPTTQTTTQPSTQTTTKPSTQTTTEPTTEPTTKPAVAPAVTDLDLVKQVAAQTTSKVDPKTLEKIIVQTQGANATPVGTEITIPRPDTTKGIPPVDVPIESPVEKKKSEVPTDVPPIEIPPVEVLDKDKKLIEPGVVEEKPLPEKEISKVVKDVVTPLTALDTVTVTPPADTVSPVEPKVKAEEPKKEETKKETKKLYPTVTSVPPPKKPGRQPIITGATPARLLADALAAYRPAGAIEGDESGKERQNVWNEKSLRLKDALGL